MGEPANLLLRVLMAMSCKIHRVSLPISWHANELKYSACFWYCTGRRIVADKGKWSEV